MLLYSQIDYFITFTFARQSYGENKTWLALILTTGAVKFYLADYRIVRCGDGFVGPAASGNPFCGNNCCPNPPPPTALRPRFTALGAMWFQTQLRPASQILH